MDRDFVDSFKKYQLSGNAWIDLNPISKLIICLCIGASTIVIYDWRFGLPLSLVVAFAAVYTKKFKEWIKMFAVVALTVFILASIIRQIGHRDSNITPMFTIFGWTWYKETFFDGLNVIQYFAGFSGTMLFWFVTTEMRDLMLAFENIGVGHETSYIMLNSMQSIIDLRKTANTILESQQCRGIETQGNIFVRLKAFFPILAPVMLSAMSGTEEKAIAMDARAFSYNGKHSFLRELKPVSTLEKIIVVLAVLFFVGSIVWRVLHGLGVI